MERIETVLQNRLTEFYHTLAFALGVKDYEKLRASYKTIVGLANQTPLTDLPYKLFQLTHSPDPFTRMLASGGLSFHFELDKKHPVHDLIQSLDQAAHVFEGNKDDFYAYIASLASESPDYPSMIQRLDADLPSLPDNMRFALTTVVVKCMPDPV